MSFTKRIHPPTYADKYWRHTSVGGYNNALNINGSVLPNCVGYVVGRMMELLGRTNNIVNNRPFIPTTNANDFYDAWIGKKGNRPRIGSVVCLDGGAYGHVAVVEQVNANGTINVSQSVWGGARFEYLTNVPTRIYPNYKVIGFCYFSNFEKKDDEGEFKMKDTATLTYYSDIIGGSKKQQPIYKYNLLLDGGADYIVTYRKEATFYSDVKLTKPIKLKNNNYDKAEVGHTYPVTSVGTTRMKDSVSGKNYEFIVHAVIQNDKNKTTKYVPYRRKWIK